MKSTHILDCTQIELPEWWPANGPKMIPLVKGEYGLDWDVVEEELPADFVKALRSMIPQRDKDHANYNDTAMVRPIGFRNRVLPKGAVIMAKA